MRTIPAFYGALIAALLLVTCVPVFSLGLPQLYLGSKFEGRFVLAAPPAGRSYILRG